MTYSLMIGALISLSVIFSPSLQVMVSEILLVALVSYPVSRLYLRRVSKDREQLIEKIFYDRQTGLPNREKLNQDIAGDGTVLYLVNIDSFKEVNDFYGNGMGDAVLESLGRRLKSLARSSYSRLFENVQLYKLEADEFAFLFSSTLEDDRIYRTADIIVEMVNDYPFQVNSSDITITITIGLAVEDPEDRSAGTLPGLMARADMALKRAKEKRVPFLRYHNSMNIPREYEENIRWTHEVKQSIREDRVVPYFQPIRNNRTGNVEKFECLMRILDGKGSIIYPETFLKISKRSRQYPSLSRIMLRKIIREMKHTSCDYSFNISVEDMQNRDTVIFIRRILENHWKEAPRLIFEILESDNIVGIPEVPEFIRLVKDYGCSIALDDFGAGYSNFNYIMTLDVDFIKIDASIIKNLDTDKNARVIAETIVGFARRTGIRTVAEYVHSRDIYDIVRSLGIDFSQGFYLGKPVESSIKDSAPCPAEAVRDR
ncbi:MAG: bifunctional diguanylate cyclase/phosphodiesterase [Spirochaetales bacterium]|nr:bifunctional diguanylate cyclase/phosphodiesterase [Spirochaetales bacterium]